MALSIDLPSNTFSADEIDPLSIATFVMLKLNTSTGPMMLTTLKPTIFGSFIGAGGFNTTFKIDIIRM